MRSYRSLKLNASRQNGQRHRLKGWLRDRKSRGSWQVGYHDQMSLCADRFLSNLGRDAGMIAHVSQSSLYRQAAIEVPESASDSPLLNAY